MNKDTEVEEPDQIDIVESGDVESFLDESEKRRMYGKTHSHILDLLTKEIGTYCVLDKTEFVNLSRDVEDLYSQAIDILAEHTHYLEKVVARIVTDIIAGTTKGKVIHNLPREKDKVWGRNQEFLVLGLNLMSGNFTKGGLAQSFKKLKIVGSLLYNALEEFCTLGQEYRECSFRLASCRLDQSAESDRVAIILKGLASDLCTQPDDVECVTYNVSILFRRIQRIHRFIFLHHSRLLIKVAKSLTNDPDQLLDNFQAGGFGLIRAIRDHNPPYDFVGYASSWIRQSILSNMRAVSNCIRVPGNVIQEFSSLERVRQKLPSNQQDLEGISNSSKKSVEKVKRIYDLVNTARTYSLDRGVNRHQDDPDSSTMSMQDLIPDESTGTDKFMTGTEVEKLLDLLDPKEKWVVANHFGLQDYLEECESRTCKESVAIERIRQLYVTTSAPRRRA